jgi:hypothetical protein
MKILITGMTARHTGTPRNKYVTVIEPLIHMLRKDMEHEVEQRTVTVNEDLSQFDKIIVYLFPIEKLGATRRFGALDALARYPDKCILSFDDWQYYQCQMYIKSCIKSGRYWNWVDKYPDFITKADFEAIKNGGREVRDRLERIAEQLRDNLTFPVLLPMFNWGDENMIGLKTTGIVKLYDPSRYAIEYVENNYMEIEFPPARKKRAWILGSLFDHHDYLKRYKFSWPVIHYGHKKTQQVLTEQQLCNVYNDYFGIVSPKYQTSGDGWWRARWIFSYMFDNIIHASDEERGNLPGSFLPRLDTFENASDDFIMDVARTQKAILGQFFMPKDGIISIVKEILK